MKKTSVRLMTRVSQGACMVALAALGAGCASVTGHHEPLAQVSLSDVKLPEASAQARANWPKNGWWRQYRDEQLNALIEQAFAGSPNLEVLASRVESAKVTADGVKKLSYPSGGIRLAPTAQTYSENYIYPASLWDGWKDSGLVRAAISCDLDL